MNKLCNTRIERSRLMCQGRSAQWARTPTHTYERYEHAHITHTSYINSCMHSDGKLSHAHCAWEIVALVCAGPLCVTLYIYIYIYILYIYIYLCILRCDADFLEHLHGRSLTLESWAPWTPAPVAPGPLGHWSPRPLNPAPGSMYPRRPAGLDFVW